MDNRFNIFDIDLDSVIENLKNIRDSITNKYNNFVNDMKKYDLNTDEGYEAFINDSAELRKELNDSDSLFAKYAVATLDKIVEHIMKEHCDKVAARKNVNDELVDAEVRRNLKEKGINNKPCDCKKSEPEIVWPSSKLTERQKRNIWGYVDRYMDEMVIPYLDNNDEEMTENMSKGLFEFAAWLLKA